MSSTAKKGAKAMRAGGRATEAGMSFQAEVGAFLAAQMLAGVSVGQGFGLAHDERIVGLRFESGSGVDDVVASLSGGGKASLQCKTSLSLSAGEKSDFAKTIGQFVEELVADQTLDPAKNVLVITVPAGEAKSLDALVAACRRVAAGGLGELSSGSEKEREAFRTLKAAVDLAWKKRAAGGTPDLQRIASLLRVRRYERGDRGAMRIEGAALIGRALYGGDAAGAAPFAQLLDAVRELIKSGHPADRQALLAELRRRGHVEVSAPGFDADIARLKADTKVERERLDRFGRLPLDDYPLLRTCQPALFAAARAGSFLVIGEPGAGKSGALGMLAAEWEARGPVVVLSVDRFASITKSRDLPEELRLEHDVVEVLAAWPGVQPGLLIIDALDAARGGQAEAIFVNLIGQMARLAPRWRVVASVRTFDLLNGQRLRQLMMGAPPSEDHVDPRASTLRHFLVPALDAAEQAKIAADLPGLAALLNAGDKPLAKLLTNIFNLSLAADLVANGVAATKFDNVATQSDLIDRYEDQRLPGIRARSAMIAAIARMVERASLSLRVADLDHAGLEELLTSGILVEREGRYAFAHHILFDHAAGRYFVDHDTADGLVAQLKALGAKAFMLAPALRFALERFWRQDGSAGHATSWKLLITLAQQRDLGPIAAAAALRTAAEQVATPADLAGLTELIKTTDLQATGNSLYQIARFIAMRIEAERLPDAAIIAWSGLAETIANSRERWFVEPARFLLYPFAEKADLSPPDVLAAFGKAARALLVSACAQDERYRNARSMGIDFVARSYASDKSASRAVLAPLLSREWMEKHGHDDARSLAAGMKHVIGVDGEFVEQVFEAIFAQPLPDETKTDMSGSRILGLTSTKRQDFESSFYQLREVFRLALKVAPEHTPALLSIAALGKRAKRYSDPGKELIVPLAGGGVVTIILDGLDLSDWRQARDYANPADVEIPKAFADHVAKAPFADLQVIIEAARSRPMAASVWRRLLGSQLAANRRGPTDILLWEVAANPAVIGTMDLGRDAIDFLRAVYPTIDTAKREAFEESVAGYKPSDRKFWALYSARLLTALPPTSLVTQKLKRRRRRLEKADGLVGNPAYMSFSGASRRALRPGTGAVAQSAAEKAASRIAKAIEKYRARKGAADLPPLWKAIRAGERLAEKSDVSEDHARQLWGAVGEGFAAFVSSRVWAPDADGGTSLAEALALLAKLAANPLPAPGEAAMGWSNDAVRVHAAKAAVSLGSRFLTEAPGLEATISTLLADGNSNVRYLAAERLWWLAKAQPERMWRLIDQVANLESNDHVLAALVAHTLSPLSESDPEAVEKRLREIDARADALPLGDNPSVTNMIAQVATAMAVDDGREPAMTMVVEWTERRPIAAERLEDAIQMLRGRFFHGYLPDTDPRVASGARAEHIGEMAAHAAARQLADAKIKLSEGTSEGPERDAIIAAYRGADATLDTLVMQLYFGSGAYREPRGAAEAPPPEVGLYRDDQKIAFLNRWSDALKVVESVATPHTAKHLLELYEFLLPADPPRLFERIAAFVTGPAKEEFYQHEQLAASDLVEFVRHMLADYRSLFDDSDRRDRLVLMLDLFAGAGWPEAMRLLWELPDLLR